MKSRLQIKSWLDGSVLFEYEAENNTLRETVEQAVKARVNLSGADLSRADLSGANLAGSNLSRADLSRADLFRADLSGSNLSRVNLSGADLFRAYLSGAYLSGADIDIWWHVHHETLWEVLTERIANRINYIKKEKPKGEVALRLKLLKPVLGAFPKDKEGWKKLHKEECGCYFDFKKHTIFTKKNGWSGTE